MNLIEWEWLWYKISHEHIEEIMNKDISPLEKISEINFVMQTIEKKLRDSEMEEDNG